MRILCLGLDGADYDLVCDLVDQGKLPTLTALAQEGAFRPLRSTIPAFTPTAWSTFLTGLNPGSHGVFGFHRRPGSGPDVTESAATRGGTPLWRLLGAAGLRSVFVTVPFTYPSGPIDGILVSGFGGPMKPVIVPDRARRRIQQDHPELRTHVQPARWWEDFPGFTRTLIDHVDEVRDVCALALELEPELSLLCVDFMSSDVAGHLMWHRLDVTHPAHRRDQAGDELVQVYQAVDRACGDLISHAQWLWGEPPTVLVMSDHGMKPVHWLFNVNRWLEEAGMLRRRRRSWAHLRGGRLGPVGELDRRLVRTRRRYGRAVDALPGRAAVELDEIDFGASRAYGFGYGGQIYLMDRERLDRRLVQELVDGLSAVCHPVTGAPAFRVATKQELYHGPFMDRAPDLALLPHDERIHVDALRIAGHKPFERHAEILRSAHGAFSGQHARTGILAAAGPGIRPDVREDGGEIAQLPATLLALLGLDADLESAPIAGLVDGATLDPVPAATEVAAGDAPALSEHDEQELLRRLRDLGYE
jgi:predicted AlkP superfamily phosphohydrolase/phosphomutase